MKPLEESFKLEPLNTQDVWQWPEFRAFVERLGIPWGLRITGMTLKMSPDSLVLVDVQFQGVDRKEKEDPNNVLMSVEEINALTTLSKSAWLKRMTVPVEMRHGQNSGNN